MSKKVELLNKRFGAEFGFCPLGSRYKWIHTTEHYYWIQDTNYDDSLLDGLDATRIEDLVAQEPGAGSVLVVPQAKYKRCRSSERFGRGWWLAVYKPPMPQLEWQALYGAGAPWPRLGEYQLIENVYMPDNAEPTEEDTANAIWAIRKNKEKSLSDHIEDAESEMRHFMRSTSSGIESELNDCLTAFGKVPGKRGGDVSLPLTKFDRN